MMRSLKLCLLNIRKPAPSPQKLTVTRTALKPPGMEVCKPIQKKRSSAFFFLNKLKNQCKAFYKLKFYVSWVYNFGSVAVVVK